MKKFVSICMILALICLSFTSCININNDKPTKEQASAASSSAEVSSTAENEDEVYHLNESAVFNELKFTATEIKTSEGANYLSPAAGNVFLGVKFTVENVSKTEQTVSSLLLFEAYADDVKISESVTAATAFSTSGVGTLDGSIAPGKKLVGWYAVEVSENWKALELHVQSSLLSQQSAKFVFTQES